MSKPPLIDMDNSTDKKSELSTVEQALTKKALEVKPNLVHSKYLVRMRMLSNQGHAYIKVGDKDIDISKDNTFTFNKMGEYIIDLEGNEITLSNGEKVRLPTVAYYEEGKPVCFYDIEGNRPLSTPWLHNSNSRSSRFTKKLFADKTLEIILKVAKSATNAQLMNILIGVVIGAPVGLIIGNALHSFGV